MRWQKCSAAMLQSITVESKSLEILYWSGSRRKNAKYIFFGLKIEKFIPYNINHVYFFHF